MKLVMLGPADVEQIVGLERRAFVPALQADAATMRRRFELGHLMFGLVEDGQLVGMQGVSYGHFDPNDETSFPKSEKVYGLQSVPANYNAVYSYNFEMDPVRRGLAMSEWLFRAMMDRAKSDGCVYVVVCARIPSYAGSDPRFPQEAFPQIPEVRQAIDAYLAGGPYPEIATLLRDPLLAFYNRMGQAVKARFHWIRSNFAPHDTASGGHRIVMYAEFKDWNSEVDSSA